MRHIEETIKELEGMVTFHEGKARLAKDTIAALAAVLVGGTMPTGAATQVLGRDISALAAPQRPKDASGNGADGTKQVRASVRRSNKGRHVRTSSELNIRIASLPFEKFGQPITVPAVHKAIGEETGVKEIYNGLRYALSQGVITKVGHGKFAYVKKWEGTKAKQGTPMPAPVLGEEREKKVSRLSPAKVKRAVAHGRQARQMAKPNGGRVGRSGLADAMRETVRGYYLIGKFTREELGAKLAIDRPDLMLHGKLPPAFWVNLTDMVSRGELMRTGIGSASVFQCGSIRGQQSTGAPSEKEKAYHEMRGGISVPRAVDIDDVRAFKEKPEGDGEEN